MGEVEIGSLDTYFTEFCSAKKQRKGTRTGDGSRFKEDSFIF